jgi:enoyl-CoA hydratase/carnithine racemase
VSARGRDEEIAVNGIRIESQGRAVILRMDKARGNAIDEAFLQEMTEACAQVSGDARVQGVVLASAHPKLFCPGLDLVTLIEYDRPALQAFMLRFAEVVWALYGLRKPMVAAINGHAVAGGCILALTADWRMLRRGGAQIGLNEVRIGVPLPWSVAVLLRSSVPPAALVPVALLGRNFADEEALAVGLVHELADGEGFEDRCLARLQELAEKENASVGTTKAYLRHDTLQQMKAREKERIGEFVDAWFAPATREWIQRAVDSLTKPK